jgi:type IV secretory pathway TraG/TraD family ATPase VirD4
MTPTKLLIGQILAVFAIVILGVWAATQWAAAMLGYQAQLGAPWAVKRRSKLTPDRRPILTPLRSVPGPAARRVAVS